MTQKYCYAYECKHGINKKSSENNKLYGILYRFEDETEREQWVKKNEKTRDKLLRQDAKVNFPSAFGKNMNKHWGEPTENKAEPFILLK